MTGSDTTSVLAQHDPKFLKARQRERRAIIVVAILAVAAVIGAGISIAKIVRTEKRVTKVEKSACADAAADPSDRQAIHECQVIRAAAEEQANLRVNCIPFERAGYICPKPGSPLAEEHRRREIREAVQEPRGSSNPNGGDATSKPSTGHSQPGPSKGGSSNPPSHPSKPSGNGQGSSPPSSPPHSTSTHTESSSSTTTEKTEVVHEPGPPAGSPETPEHPAPVAEGVGAAVEGVGHTIEEAGSSAGEAAKGLTCGLGLAC